jgi:hypothetical protein
MVTSHPPQSLESDADDQMLDQTRHTLTLQTNDLNPQCRIIRIPFTASVKLRALLLKTGPTDQTPSKVVLVLSSPDSFLLVYLPV